MGGYSYVYEYLPRYVPSLINEVLSQVFLCCACLVLLLIWGHWHYLLWRYCGGGWQWQTEFDGAGYGNLRGCTVRSTGGSMERDWYNVDTILGPQYQPLLEIAAIQDNLDIVSNSSHICFRDTVINIDISLSRSPWPWFRCYCYAPIANSNNGQSTLLWVADVLTGDCPS